MGRGGAQNDVKGARRCLIEGNGQNRYGLIRFTLSPDNIVTPDLTESLGGRGVWLTSSRNHVDEACKKKLFARGFKQPVELPDDLSDLIESLLAKRLISLMALSRKSGQITFGRERVHEMLQFQDRVILLQARDGSTREKRNIGPKEGVTAQFEILDSTELGMVFGRENVIHCALTENGISDRIIYEAHRLSGFRVVDNLKTE